MAATVADLAGRALRRLGVAAVAAADRPGASFTANLTTDEIARGALAWIGVVGSGEAPEVSDLAYANAKVMAVHDDLVAQGIAPWGGDYVIPRFVSEDYIMLTALHLAPSFGKGGDPDAVIRLQSRIRLKAMLRSGVAEQAVQDVHSALASQNRVRWTVFDIPDYVENAYVVLAANLLAPAFGVAVDEVGQLRAERTIAQAIALPASGEPLQQEYF